MTAPVPSLDFEHVGATALRTTMLGITAITDIVGTNIHWQDIAEDDTAYPHIVISQMAGGWENQTDSNAADVEFFIIGYTANKSVANALRKALGLLHREVLDTSDFSVNNVRAYARVRKQTNYYMKDDGQNKPIYGVGGVFRVRLTIL